MPSLIDEYNPSSSRGLLSSDEYAATEEAKIRRWRRMLIPLFALAILCGIAVEYAHLHGGPRIAIELAILGILACIMYYFWPERGKKVRHSYMVCPQCNTRLHSARYIRDPGYGRYHRRDPEREATDALSWHLITVHHCPQEEAREIPAKTELMHEEHPMGPTKVDLVALLLAFAISAPVGLIYLWVIAFPSRSDSLVTLTTLVFGLPLFILFWWIRNRLFRHR